MALFGSGFDSTQPTDVSDISAGAGWIRDIKTKLVSFLTVMFDLNTGYIKTGAITTDMLSATGVTPGTIGGITYDAKGRITGGTPATTLAGFGITDAMPLTEGTIKRRVVTLTSALAGTAVEILSDADVGAGKRAYILDIDGRVNGATAWIGVTNIKVKDNSNVDQITIDGAPLAANYHFHKSTTSVTLESPVYLGTGGTLASGMKLVGSSNGTGSDLIVIMTFLVK